jgi:hypothetical protein
MKTKLFLLVCLLAGAFTPEISAQNGKGGTNGTDKYVIIQDWANFDLEIECDGTVIDVVRATDYSMRVGDHYAYGTITKFNENANNCLATSLKTGEVFKVQMIERGFDLVDIGGDFNFEEGAMTSTFHYIGDKGNRYFVRITKSVVTWEVFDYEAKCMTKGK